MSSTFCAHYLASTENKLVGLFETYNINELYTDEDIEH